MELKPFDLSLIWAGGNTPLRSYLGALKEADFDGVISLELEYEPDPSQIVPWVTEAYEQTKAIMLAAGVLAAGVLDTGRP